jgi:ferritin-like metal-binding protein YciE
MQSTRELFLHGLREMLDGEHRILDILREQQEETSDSRLQDAFQLHHRQTQKQISRLEQCFELIGEEAEPLECAGIKGLREEREGLIAEDPSSDILDIFNVASAMKVELYEIASYESLIRLAEAMGQIKVVRALTQNLREEEQTLRKLAALAARIKPQEMAPQKEHSGLQLVRKRGARGGRVA